MDSHNYRILFVPSIELNTAGAFCITAECIEDARKILDAIASYTLHLHSNLLMQDYSNTGWIEQFRDGEWQEIPDEDI